jgi:multidrug efflux system outer membrane protein
MSIQLTTRIVPLLAALVLAACASVPEPGPGPGVSVPAQFRAAAPVAAAAATATATPATTPSATVSLEGWAAFGDPLLPSLVEQAGQGNAGLRVTEARLAQARALVRSAGAQGRPQLSAQASASRDGGASVAESNRFGLGLAASWEPDFSGRTSAAERAATLDAQAAEAALRQARLAVQADVARTLLALRALDVERSLVRDTVAAYADTLRLTERRAAAGDVAELDLARVRTELAANEAEALVLERRRAALEHALAVLVGVPASGFAVAPLEGAALAAAPRLPAGVPSEVLARRADVAAAQARWQAAAERVGIARTAWFPSVVLTAQGGVGSGELSELLKSSARGFGLAALLAAPLLDGGRREAGVAQARADVQAAAGQARETMLQALREVEDQLSALALLGRQAAVQSRSVDSAAQAVRLSDARWRNGLVSQLELLDARRTELNQRRAALQVQAAQTQAAVGLWQALGG